MIRLNLGWLLTVLMIYICYECAKAGSVEDIKDCMKTLPGEICIKMHKGL